MYSFSRQASLATRSDVRDLLRFASLPDMISFSGGLPAAELFDLEGIRQASEAALSLTPQDALQYGMTEGQPALREALVQHLAGKGLRTEADRLVVTTGSQQALDLVARAMLDPGDFVVVERPTYLAALQAFRLTGAQLISVDSDSEGGCFAELDALCAARRPKLIYVVSNFANPSGQSLSMARRRALVRWAAAHQVLVLEDDPYGELRTRGAALPSLAALAQDIPGAAPWVAQTSTLSKSIAPGLRVGWLYAAPALAEKVVSLKQAVDLHTSSFTQEVAARYLASGRLGPHLERVCAEYQRRREALQEALYQAFGEDLSFDEPEGGMFLWARFTDGTLTRPLLEHALAARVMFVPGDAFYPDHPDASSLRLNFSASSPERIREGVRRLAGAHAALRRAL